VVCIAYIHQVYLRAHKGVYTAIEMNRTEFVTLCLVHFRRYVYAP